MNTMNLKLAEMVAEVGKKTASFNVKHSMFYFFNEPKMPKSLIQKQK